MRRKSPSQYGLSQGSCSTRALEDVEVSGEYEARVLATKQRAVGALELASIEWPDGALQAARIDGGLLAE